MNNRIQKSQHHTRSLAAVYVGLAALLALLPQAGAGDKKSSKVDRKARILVEKAAEAKKRAESKAVLAKKRAEILAISKLLESSTVSRPSYAVDSMPIYVDSSDFVAIESLSLRRSSIRYPGYYVPPSAQSLPQGELVVDSSKAGLKTNPEHERKLVRAEDFAKKGRVDLAVVLWQMVLNESTDTVMTRDEWQFTARERTYQKYRSVADEVERMIAKLPPAGLKLYRLRADGEAKSIIAATLPERREEALSAVVRKYFLSTFGDDAAFELACRRLDRGEFLGASQLLSKILQEYPDSNIPKNEVLMRLAVAQARVGDLKAAQAALKPLKADPPRGSQQLLALIEQDVRNAGKTLTEIGAASHDSWPMALGGASRTGHMKSPSSLGKGTNLTELWSRDLGLGFFRTSRQTTSSRGRALPSVSPSYSRKIVTSIDTPVTTRSFTYTSRLRPYNVHGQTAQSIPSTVTSHEQLVKRWTSNGWMPTGQMLMDGNRIYLKFRTELVCLDAETNRVLWRSLWKNNFTPDSATARYKQLNMRRPGGVPSNAFDVQLFGDLVHQSMSMSGGMVFNIEGSRFDDVGGALDKPKVSKPAAPVHWGQPLIIRRTRTNSLTAYDAKTGKLRWHRPAGGKPGDVKSDVGFLAAPVPYARLLLAPVTEAGEIWLIAMDRATGETVWRTSLCDEPAGGCSPWSPVGVSIDGGEAYVATGAGVIFAVDAMNGGIRWGFRYPRVGRKNPYMQQRFGSYGRSNTMLELEGMNEDVVIPRGRVLVVMASDYNRIFAIDRRSGEFLWDTPMRMDNGGKTVTYCLGTHGNAVFLAGKDSIRRYSITGGKLEWEKSLKESDISLGRGIVTDEALFVPVKDSVMKLSLSDGKELDQMGVVLEDREPVGNLYSDGDRLFALGPGRLTALGDIKTRIKELDRRVTAGDMAARLERMDLRARLKQFPGAVADLRVLFAERAKSDPKSAYAFLISALTQLDLPTADPLTTIALLSEGNASVASQIDAKSGLETALQERDQQIRSVLESIRDKKAAGSVATVLTAGEMCRQKYTFDLARDTIRKIAVEQDRAILVKALAAKHAKRRRLAIAGIAKVADAPSLTAVKSNLTDSDDDARIDAAVLLANRGQREGLPVLVALLKSPKMVTRVRTSSLLQRMTGKSFGYLAYSAKESRDAAINQWKQWLKTEIASAVLRPVNDVQPILGRTLIAIQGRNIIEEYDSRHRKTNQKTVASPTAVAGASNGHRFVASYSRSEIIEYDTDWKTVRTISTSKWGQPYSVTWVENGNVLVSCFRNSSGRYEGNVLEYDPSGKIVWRFAFTGLFGSVQRLSNGNTLIAIRNSYIPRTYSGGIRSGRRTTRTSYSSSVGKVVEVDPNRKIVREIKSISYPSSAQMLENGNVLISDMNRNRIVEVTTDGRLNVVKTGLVNPRTAQRLPNGHTVIAHNRGVTEFDAKGNQVWFAPAVGTVGAIRY